MSTDAISYNGHSNAIPAVVGQSVPSGELVKSHYNAGNISQTSQTHCLSELKPLGG